MQQEAADRFYWSSGPCCAGCDWWERHSSLTGQCTRSAPVAASERVGMIGITGSSLAIGAGHPFTNRDHRCGDFADTFEWGTLPVAYRKRIGAPVA